MTEGGQPIALVSTGERIAIVHHPIAPRARCLPVVRKAKRTIYTSLAEASRAAVDGDDPPTPRRRTRASTGPPGPVKSGLLEAGEYGASGWRRRRCFSR